MDGSVAFIAVMLSTESRRHPADLPHRPTVRIVKRRLPPRAALISLFITAAAAVSAFLTWRLWREDPETGVFQRSLSDVTLTYRCERGDVFRAPGQATPAACPACGRPAYPVTVYACEVHGNQDAIARFQSTNRDGEPAISQIRILPNGEWDDVEDGVRCPRCGREMIRKSDDAIDFNKLKKRDSDGAPQRQPPATGPEGPRLEDRETPANPPPEP